jgi:hypothetical protein
MEGRSYRHNLSDWSCWQTSQQRRRRWIFLFTNDIVVVVFGLVPLSLPLKVESFVVIAASLLFVVDINILRCDP